MGRNRRRNVRADQREAAEHRENLERRWQHDLESDPAFGDLVTARQAREEPYHRWLGYVQGFAPALVRRFLDASRPAAGDILDPFNGSGTVTTECARAGRTAVGVEAVPALACVARARFLGPPPPWADLPVEGSFEVFRQRAAHPTHCAAVLLAAAATVTGEGRQRALAATPADLVRTRLRWMAEDTARPLPGRARIVCADARYLPFADGVFGGLLTSPPYLSRYDYAKINAPMDRLYRGAGRRATRRHQVRAAPVLAKGSRFENLAPAAEEAARAFAAQGDPASARLVRAYFHDLGAVLAGIHRVLRPGAPAWIVLGGADLHHVYVPSDLIVAEHAAGAGFVIEKVVVARRLRPSGRRLGTLHDVAPRESVVMLRKPR